MKHQLIRTNKHFRDVLDAIGLDEAFDEAFSMMAGCEKKQFGKSTCPIYTKEERKQFDKKMEELYKVHPLEQM